MQVNETKNEGLSREFSITIPANDISVRVDAKLQEVGATVNMAGFRPGKVPLNVLRQRYGKSVLGEILESAVNETSQEVMQDNDIRPAMQPQIEVESFDEGADLVYKMSVDCMPEIPDVDYAKVKLTKLKAVVSDKEIDEALEKLQKDFKKSEPISKARKTKTGDVVVMDFVGSVDGVEFPGGAGEDFQLELGSNQFIPGFEDQMVGKNAGEDSFDVTVTFPAEYHADDLAGKEAVFVVTIKEIREQVEQEINDEFAKSLGLEDLATLRTNVAERIGKDYDQMSRTRLKRELLDTLHETLSYDVPPRMVEQEFDQIWQQFEQAKEAGQLDEDEASRSEEDAKAEYHDIAARRVMLGLLLSELGTKNNIEVSQEDVNKAMIQEAQRYPGQEAQVLEMYQKNPQALASLQAPIFEDKVVDFLFEMVTISDKEVSLEELMKDPDDEKPAEKKAKKAAAKKTTAKKATAKKAASKKPAAKKS